MNVDKCLLQAKINELSLKAVEIFKDFAGDNIEINKNKFGLVLKIDFKKDEV